MSDSRSAVEPVDDRIIHLSIDLPVAADVAFGYFSRPELVQHWLAPQAVIDARAGGRYQLFWDPADPENDSTVGCRVTAARADPLTHVVVAFHPHEGGTTVHLVHSRWRSDDMWEQARVWQEAAWSVAFGQLADEIDAA